MGVGIGRDGESTKTKTWKLFLPKKKKRKKKGGKTFSQLVLSWITFSPVLLSPFSLAYCFSPSSSSSSPLAYWDWRYVYIEGKVSRETSRPKDCIKIIPVKNSKATFNNWERNFLFFIFFIFDSFKNFLV